MIKIPYNIIISKIQDKTSLSESEIIDKINEKVGQLSGLISKEGAAHIVANELSVNLFENTTGSIKLKDIFVGMRSIEILVKIISKNPIRTFVKDKYQGKVCSLEVGDETDSLRVVFWNDQCDLVDKFNEGNTVLIKNAYVKENLGRLEVHMSDKSTIELSDQIIKGVRKATFSSKRVSIKELKDNDQNVEILGNVVQLFNPVFFEVCPYCNKRARQRENVFFCEEHKEVKPSYSYVINAVIDDGTENIRSVFFRKQVENLLNLSEITMLAIKDNPDTFESIKQNTLGKFVKLIGRVKKNSMFDRLEFYSNEIFEPNPDEELERLK